MYNANAVRMTLDELRRELGLPDDVKIVGLRDEYDSGRAWLAFEHLALDATPAGSVLACISMQDLRKRVEPVPVSSDSKVVFWTAGPADFTWPAGVAEASYSAEQPDNHKIITGAPRK